MGTDREDQSTADFWFHRNRQLDRIDQQAQTARELERLQLRGGESRGDDHSRSAEKGGERLKLTSDQLAARTRERHRQIIQRIRGLPSSVGPRDEWVETASRINPLQAGAERSIEALRSDVRRFANNTSTYSLGRGSLGTGMTIQNDLLSIATDLFLFEQNSESYTRGWTEYA